MVEQIHDYDKAIAALLELLEPEDPQYAEILTLKARLHRVEKSMQMFGESPQDSAEWGKIVHALTTMALDVAGIGLDELAARDAVLEPLLTSSSRPYPFPGLDSLGTEDKDIFFGRDHEIEDLLTNIQQDSVVVVNGLSGSGKSSLIKAGIIPPLLEMDYLVLYTPVFEDIVDDVRKQIQQALGNGEVAEKWEDDLCHLHEKVHSPIILIVDQFEQALSPQHDADSLKAFLQGIPRLVSLVERFATIVIVVRADWLYYLENSVKQIYPKLNVHSCIFTVDPLDEQAAREAIIRPMEQWGLPYDQPVVDGIIRNLRTNSKELAIGSYIQPIQLQIVLRRLFSLAEDRGNWRQALLQDNYEASGGVESILRNYLTDSVGPRSEAWHLLARFIGPDGRTGRTLRHSELLAVPAAEDVEMELRFLVSQSLVEVYQPQDRENKLYRLSHDYLVEAIRDYLEENVDHLGWKLAEDWLVSGTIDWKESRQRGDDQGLLLEKDRYLHIYEYRDRLKIQGDAQRLLLLSALHYGHIGIGYWISRGDDPDQDIQTLTEHLLNPSSVVQESARVALRKSLSDSKNVDVLLNKQSCDLLRDQVYSAFKKSENPQKQTAAARALWILNDFKDVSEQYRVGSVVLRQWFNEHAVQVGSYVMTMIVVMLVIFSGLYVRNRLQGTWHTIYTLKAGMVSQLAVDPDEPTKMYVLAEGGPEPREGLSLFVKQDDSWEMLSHDFAKAEPVDMEVIRDQEQETRIYLALRGRGMLRSENLGQTWELSNQGLPSRGFTDLVVDPGDKSTLYLATQDFRGVLRSENGGESWDFYDHHGEIYGAIINALEFTQANNGTLIAGTANGKILTHSREGNTWEARYGLPKGSIKSLAAAPSDKKTIYAGTDRGVVIRSVDGGQLWTVLGQISNTFKVTNLAVHPDMPNYLYATTYGSGGNTLWSSQDSGLNWRQLSAIGLPRSGIHALSVDRNDPDTLFTGTSEGLFVSRDAGMHWEQMNLSAPLASIKAVAMHPVSPTPVYAASNASVFVNPEGDLCHWIRGKGLRAEELRTLIVDPVDPSRVYVGVRLLDEWSVFTSTDGGREWKQTAEPSIEPPVSDITALAAGKTPEGQTILYAGSLGCGIFRSDDRGENWETFGRVHCSDSGDSMPMEAHFLAVDASSPMHVYAAAGQAVYYSENGGQTWHRSQWVASQDPDSRVQTSIESPIVGLAADPLSSAVAYLVTRANGVWKTENGGASWRSLGYPWSDSMEPTVLTTRPEESGHLIVGSSNGEVWQSEDGGHHWKAIREDLAVGRITSIAANQSWEDKILIGSIQDGMAIYVPGELFSKADAKRSVQCSEVISTKP